MRQSTKTFAALSAFLISQVGAVSQWGQCGGINYTGSTTCDAGLTCVYLNDYYYQCQVASSTPSPSSTRPPSTSSKPSSTSSKPTSTSTSSKKTTTTSSTTSSKPTTTSTPTSSAPSSPTSPSSCPSNSPVGGGKFKYFGTNISGFDFSCSIDGTCSVTGAYPPLTQYYGLDGEGQMRHFVEDDGFNTFRLPVSWQYLVNDVLGGTLDPDNWTKYDALVQACLNLGAYCIVDIHNYARWNGQIIGQGGPTNAQFADLWSQIATKYAGIDHVIFGIMNEPHDIPDINAWADSVQAAVTAIRNAGANQVCLLPGNDWTSAEKFISNGSADALSKVKNPDGSYTNLIFDVHKYLDSDNSGTSPDCYTNNISNAFAPLAQWLRCHGRQAFNSETGGGNTDSCNTYFCQQIAFEQANSDVIVGVTGWAAGNFYPGYVLGETPTNNNGVWTDTSLVATCLVPYAPN